MITEHDWIWDVSSIIFKPMRYTHEPVFGKQMHQYADPHWMFELQLPPASETTRKAVEAILELSEGVNVFNVYDPRVPRPSHHSTDGAVPALTVKGVDRATSAILVAGSDGDVITQGDPIAFTHNGQRHYYKALQDLTLTGLDQSLPVYIRPRVDLASVTIAAERIRPTQRFSVNMQETGGQTTARDDRTSIMLKGVEYWGVV